MGEGRNLRNMQVNRRLLPFKEVSQQAQVRGGWIHYLRTALQMTLSELGSRVGVSTSAIAQSERNEVSGKTTLETLRKIAAAMDCELVYAMVPRDSAKTIEDILMKNAMKKANRLLHHADLHMSLEDQRVETDFESRVDSLAKALIEKGDVW
jgi:predicted DNA-binding mobile mystery protein A